MGDSENDAFWHDAIKAGMTAEDQYYRLKSAQEKCWEAAKKVKGIVANARAYESCNAMEARMSFLSDNLKAIDDALDRSVPPPDPRGQAASDSVYSDTFFGHASDDPDALQAAIDTVLKAIHTTGMTPSLRAQIGALNALKNGLPYNPPIYDPNAHWDPPGGKQTPDEKPDVGG